MESLWTAFATMYQWPWQYVDISLLYSFFFRLIAWCGQESALSNQPQSSCSLAAPDSAWIGMFCAFTWWEHPGCQGRPLLCFDLEAVHFTASETTCPLQCFNLFGATCSVSILPMAMPPCDAVWVCSYRWWRPWQKILEFHVNLVADCVVERF